MFDDSAMFFTGNSNPALSKAVAAHLQVRLGKASVGRFSDGEVAVEIEENVRSRDVFVLQSICQPTNDNLIELLVLIDALRRASRVPITAKVVANMIASVGTHRVLTLDLHADQIQGFFDMPMDNIYASPVLLGDIWKHEYPDLMVVSPDVGGVVRARAVARRLDNADLAIIDKRRPRANEAQVMNIIGDVEGRSCVVVDDMVDTAGTLCKAAEALKEHGARKVVAYCTHPVLSGAAIKNISASVLDELVVTDTIPLTAEARACECIRQLTVAELIGESINRINRGQSLSSMFVD
jgi:ribose-phosphate pyrophosphokinase